MGFSQNLEVVEGEKVDSLFLEGLPKTTQILQIESSRIKSDVDFSIFTDLKEIMITDCKSKNIILSNDSLKYISIQGGRHNRIHFGRLRKGVYIDLSGSGVEEVSGFKPVEDRVRYLFFANNKERISGFEEVWFTQLQYYSFAPDVAAILHDPTKIKGVFNCGGSLEIYNQLNESGQAQVEIYRFYEYAQRFKLFRGVEISRRKPDMF
jgi:hypothetical protein